jgi:hypothetical protein
MNGDTSSDRDRWRGLPRRARVLAVMAGIVMLAAACGGSPSSTSGTGASAQFQQNLAFAQCMRSHGLPNFPDPNANGQGFGNQQQANQEHSDPHFGTAFSACQHLLPSTPSSPGTKVIPSQAQLVRFAQCMRSHGVPNYPDPNPNGGLGAALAQLGINPNSPQFQAPLRTCNRLVPMPSQRGGS